MGSFTAQATVRENTVSTANVVISVNPEEEIITIEKMIPGEEDSGTVTASNEGDVDFIYFLSADWRADGDTTARMATILANRLEVTVVADPENDAVTLFEGVMADLLDEEGRELGEGESEDVEFTLKLPEDASNILQGIDLKVDFVFVAEAVEEYY